MQEYRLNRLFHGRSRRCLNVAMDHGFFNEMVFLAGIEDMEKAIRLLADCGPDAIQLTVGQARHLQSLPGRNKPALVLRTDVANVYGRDLPRFLFSRMIEEPVEQALRLDAACVVANLFSIPGQPEVTDQCIQNILALKPACVRAGMPLMIEPLVFSGNGQGGYGTDGDPERIIPLVRQAVELGADIIKSDPTADPGRYREVVRIAGGIPVLVRGGGKVDDAECLRRTEAVLAQGASGIVYGRNIIQHPKPGTMVKALLAVVHDGVDSQAALRSMEQK